jgi:ArsR family transcriptional regulator, cadmium/lead-responsive transcriptional repressor
VADSISGVFAALADPTRRSIYEDLLKSGDGRNATEIAQVADVSRQAVVKHLQVLVRAGLATSTGNGREVRYLVTQGGTSDVVDWLARSSATWDRRIAVLRAQVENEVRRRSP